MDSTAYHDGNIAHLLQSRLTHVRHDINHSMQMHSSLIRRLSQERELEGHTGCVNAVAWNSRGSLLISGSDDTQVNIWCYSTRKLLHSIDSGHTANIFCTKFMPETSDELVASGAGDAEVRLFNLSRISGSGTDESALPPSALFECHTRRVKKLAVEIGNPNVVWSASEDGTLRQHDIREGSSCPPAGSSHQECRSVLLDLRCGAKKSLADPPKHSLALKSCDISTTRPHLLLVGGSDAYARLYDRRMLSPLTSSRRRISPPPCVNYFCPMHLSNHARSSLHLTHVTFSPNGEEVLISYSGEHVYLMSVDCGNGGSVQYSSGDASKKMIFTPISNGMASQLSASDAYQDNLHMKTTIDARLDKHRKLLQTAEKSLREGNNYYYAIEACNEVLDGRCCEIGPALWHECLCTRAALLLKRKWKNDAYMAIRDCNSARGINDSSFRALYCMSEALSQLGKHKEALEFAFAAQCLAPSNTEVTEAVENIKKRIAAVESGKNSKAKDRAPRSESRTGRVLSLSNMFYRSEANRDGSQDGPRSEREDSDYEDDLELDFETSVSGDEGRDVDSNFLHGSLNHRLDQRGDSAKATGCLNGSSGEPSSSSQNDGTSYQSETVIDMKQRYVGHCNIGTDIKQASFLGQKGEFVASGSDDGRWFIWEKQTGRLIKMLLGDEAVVNCVQCHPFDSVVATSGIDNTIKIWTPSASVPSVVAGGKTEPETATVLDAMESNERRLCRSREAILPLQLVRMHEFTEGTLRPFECAQIESGKNSKAKDRAPRSESRTGRVLSLSNMFYRSEANRDGSQDGPRSEREDSDYEDDLELDFETSVSGDEGRDVDSNFLHGSLNHRLDQRGDSAKATGCLNGSSGEPSSSSQNDGTSYQSETVIDMKQRYVGHCNIGTDIKQASFLGQKGEFVASGSDDGRWFIWEKQTGRLIKMLLGDEAVVNCVQCHPFDSVVATSGIDNTIKIWTPSASVPSVVAGGKTEPETATVLDAMESNERRLCRSREAILPLQLVRMHEFTEGTLRPFECAQS